MATATEYREMAKVKGRPKKPGGEGTQVRIDSDIAKMGRYLITDTDYSLTQYLSEILRPVIEQRFRDAGRNLMSELKPKGK